MQKVDIKRYLNRLYYRPISKMLYSSYMIFVLRFIDTEVLYLPRVQSCPEILTDEIDCWKTVLLRRKKSKETDV